MTVSIEPASLTQARELTRELTTELVALVKVPLTLRGVGAAVNRAKDKLDAGNMTKEVLQQKEKGHEIIYEPKDCLQSVSLVSHLKYHFLARKETFLRTRSITYLKNLKRNGGLQKRNGGLQAV